MSEEDIKRIENKINMLYKIVCDIGGYAVSNRLDELIPLFNLSDESKLFEEYEKLARLLIVELEKEEEMKNKYKKLENDWLTRNSLVRERKMPEMVSNQKGKIYALNKMAEHFGRVECGRKEFRRELLWLRLNKKLGRVLKKKKKVPREDGQMGSNDREFEITREFEEEINSLRADLKEYKKL